MNVYDFDNTIYRGESGVDMFLYFLKNDPKLLLALPWAINCITQYKSGRMSIEDGIEKYSVRIEDYCRKNLTDVDYHVKHFWDTHSYKIKNFYLQQRKEDDVILSAALDVMIAEICKRLGIHDYIATETDVENMKLVRLCFKENKVKFFREKYPDAVVENFYTDSYNDKSMIDLAQHAFLVKGNKITQIK